jgi:hypothetical protein
MRDLRSSTNALTEWAALAARSPRDPAPLLAPIQALVTAGRLAEAAVLLDAGRARFPDHTPFAIEAARIAQLQGRAEEAPGPSPMARDYVATATEGATGTLTFRRETGHVEPTAAELPAASAHEPVAPAARWQQMSERELTAYFREYGAKVRAGALRLGRHHYALALALAVRMTIHCGHGRMTAIELGVAAGAGLLELCDTAAYLQDALGVQIKVYGFDSSVGLPPLEGYMDHPELWHTGAFKMPDPRELRAKLPPFAKLVIGDVGETIPALEADVHDAPIGFIAFDVDLYSSTKRALQILKFSSHSYLPGVALIFDDSGTVMTHSDWCGEAAAVREFNEENTLRKIDRKPTFSIAKFAVGQIFDHPIRQGRARARFGLSLGAI